MHGASGELRSGLSYGLYVSDAGVWRATKFNDRWLRSQRPAARARPKGYGSPGRVCCIRLMHRLMIGARCFYPLDGIISASNAGRPKVLSSTTFSELGFGSMNSQTSGV